MGPGRTTPRRARYALALTSLTALLASGASALADASSKSTYRLEWKVDPSARTCTAPAARSSAAVVDRLGFDPFADEGPNVIRLKLWREHGRHRLSLTFIDEHGAVRSARQLEQLDPDDCRAHPRGREPCDGDRDPRARLAATSFDGRGRRERATIPPERATTACAPRRRRRRALTRTRQRGPAQRASSLAARRVAQGADRSVVRARDRRNADDRPGPRRERTSRSRVGPGHPSACFTSPRSQPPTRVSA